VSEYASGIYRMLTNSHIVASAEEVQYALVGSNGYGIAVSVIGQVFYTALELSASDDYVSRSYT
jgi:hypothetical protein